LSKKALFILTSRSHYDDGSQTGLWLEEASVPYEVLTEAGIDVDLVSIEGGSVPIDDNSTQNDELNKYASFVEKIKDVPSIQDIKVEDYDASLFTWWSWYSIRLWSQSSIGIINR
jgi:putative intracellular protease/amidase